MYEGLWEQGFDEGPVYVRPYQQVYLWADPYPGGWSNWPYDEPTWYVYDQPYGANADITVDPRYADEVDITNLALPGEYIIEAECGDSSADITITVFDVEIDVLQTDEYLAYQSPYPAVIYYTITPYGHDSFLPDFVGHYIKDGTTVIRTLYVPPPYVVCSWDGKDDNGAWVEPKEYTVLIEVEKGEVTASATHTIIVHAEVEVVSVDASDPLNTNIHYLTNPLDALISSVSFSAPGTTGSKTDVSGSFHFSYNQADAGWSSNIIRLEYGSLKFADCTITKTQKSPDAFELINAYFLVDGVGYRTYSHELCETYNPHVYSVTCSGKTIYTQNSTTLVDFAQDYDNISTWTESHKYSWSGGETEFVSMWAPENVILPPTTRARFCDTKRWCIRTDLVGVSKCTGLLWDYGYGSTPATIFNPEVDRSMPE
ncbi:hypothetical protein ES703_87379 [subsurface metagenome]